METEFVDEPDTQSSSNRLQRTSRELEELIKDLQARTGSWAVFSRHASPAAASGRRSQVQKAKRYEEYPLEWATRRMPTEENPRETALLVRWITRLYVSVLDPPPVGTAATDREGQPWMLFDIDGDLHWAGITRDEDGQPKPKKIKHFDSASIVSYFRICYTPQED